MDPGPNLRGRLRKGCFTQPLRAVNAYDDSLPLKPSLGTPVGQEQLDKSRKTKNKSKVTGYQK